LQIDRGLIVQVRGEAIPEARYRADDLRSEQLAQRADLYLKVVFLDHQPGPDEIQQLGLAHQPIAPGDKRQQHLERPRPQRCRLPVHQHLAGRRANLGIAKANGRAHVASGPGSGQSPDGNAV
jgi:hypothetical protein